MSYNLNSIYNVVIDWEAQWKKGTYPQNESGPCQLVAEAIESIHHFPAWFLQKAANLESSEALNLAVDIQLTAITDLLNRVEKLPDWSSVVVNSHGKQNNSIIQMKSALLTAFYWVKRTFSAWVSVSQPLPLRLAKEAEEVLTAELPGMAERLKSAGMEPHWIETISNALSLAVKDSRLTCHQSDYLGSLYAGLPTKELTVSNNRKIVKWLIEHNLNLPGIVGYAIEQYRQCESDSLSLSIQQEEVEQWIRMAEDTQDLNPGFYPKQPSCKEAILAALKAGRVYLDNKCSGLAAIYGSNTLHQPSAKNTSPLTITLSVSQLAVFCRLFSDCGMIQHSNQTELLKMVAGALQTTRATNISADSLRAKYYSPDRSSVAMVKECLPTEITLHN